MGAHELAFVGLAGSGLGTAVGMPLVWSRSDRSLDVRLLGAAVLLMSAIGALISARLAGFVPATDEVEHVINVLGLCTFPLLVFYTRYATRKRRSTGLPSRPVTCRLPFTLPPSRSALEPARIAA